MNAIPHVAPFGGKEALKYTNPHDPQVIQLEIADVIQRTGDLLVGNFFPIDPNTQEVVLPSLEHIAKNVVFYRKMLGVYLRLILENPGVISGEELAQLKYKDNMSLAQLLYGKKLIKNDGW